MQDEQSEFTRFRAELEFIQCLCHMGYLNRINYFRFSCTWIFWWSRVYRIFILPSILKKCWIQQIYYVIVIKLSSMFSFFIKTSRPRISSIMQRPKFYKYASFTAILSLILQGQISKTFRKNIKSVGIMWKNSGLSVLPIDKKRKYEFIDFRNDWRNF